MIATNMTVEPLDNGLLRVELFLHSASSGPHLAMLSANCDKFDVDIKKYSDSRTLKANKYFWKLIDQLAVALKTDRIELYKECVRKVGLFDDVAILRDLSDTFVRHHTSKGIAWQVEEL